MSDPLTYKDAGVDIAAADALVDDIKSMITSTHKGRVVPATAAFAGLVRAPTDLAEPLIAATCDGVGTKLLVAKEAGIYQGLGQDLVAMNVNDLLPVGARPLLFLDYIATGKLDPAALGAVVRGATAACEACGCVFLGGETAEMPGLYAPGEFDLAGFAVGMVDRGRVPKGDDLAVGDRILALPSSGVHSNGLSLARAALFERGGLTVASEPTELSRSLGAELLEPTRLYVNEALDLMSRVAVKASVHVTGGGLLGRAGMLAKSARVRIDPSAYPRPPIFDLIAGAGGVADEEMARTFNMGLGYLVVVSPEDAERAGGEWQEVGEITSGEPGVELGYAAG